MKAADYDALCELVAEEMSLRGVGAARAVAEDLLGSGLVSNSMLAMMVRQGRTAAEWKASQKSARVS